MSNGEVMKACLACGEKATSRGLCRACYTIARLRVNSNLTTWEWLENHNLATKSTKKEKVSKFSEAFNAALQADQASGKTTPIIEVCFEADQHQQQNAANAPANLAMNRAQSAPAQHAPPVLVPQGYDADGNQNPPRYDRTAADVQAAVGDYAGPLASVPASVANAAAPPTLLSEAAQGRFGSDAHTDAAGNPNPLTRGEYRTATIVDEVAAIDPATGYPQPDPARIQAIEDEKSIQYNAQEMQGAQQQVPAPEHTDAGGNPISAPSQPYYAPPPSGAEIPGRQTVVPQQPADIPARPWEQ